jgi:hypothetical protein
MRFRKEFGFCGPEQAPPLYSTAPHQQNVGKSSRAKSGTRGADFRVAGCKPRRSERNCASPGGARRLDPELPA